MDTLDPRVRERILGEAQREELRLARSFRECRGLSPEQLEDLYQETALALMSRPRPHRDEEHLRNALRRGLKHRALNLLRDESRRRAILAGAARGAEALGLARMAEETPESLALARHDRLVVKEFRLELTATERRVFELMSEGMKYNGIATAFRMPANEVRNCCSSIEKKRERFQLLYEKGRLCGYRAESIRALLRGELASRDLAERALAHLEACPSCRSEHNANAARLRGDFERHAAALAPASLLLGRFGWATHARRALNLVGRARSIVRGGVRQRVATLLGGGAGAKLAGGAAVVALLAGGAAGGLRANVSSHRLLASHQGHVAQTSPPLAEDRRLSAGRRQTAGRAVRARTPAKTLARPHVLGLAKSTSSTSRAGAGGAPGFPGIGFGASAPSRPNSIRQESARGAFSP